MNFLSLENIKYFVFVLFSIEYLSERSSKANRL